MIVPRRLLSLLLLACAAPVVSIPAAQAGQRIDDKAALRAIEDAIEQEDLETSFFAQFRAGKPIKNFSDFSLVPVRRSMANVERWKTALARIHPDRLDETGRQTYRILQFETSGVGLDEAEYWLTFDLTPYQAPMTFGLVHQVMAAQPLATAADAANYVRLTDSYAAMLDTLVAKVEGQTRRGILMPKAILPTIRSTWQSLAGGAGTLRPDDARLAKLDPAARTRLTADLDRLLAQRIAPAYARIDAIVGPDYEAKAPAAVGLGQYPGGQDLYRKLIRRYTTLDRTPEQLHRQGLTAVAEIGARMQAIRTQLGFTGSSRAFYDKLSTDPRFLAKTPAEVEATYWRYVQAIEPKVAGYFRAVPKAPYGVKRLPPAAEPGQTFGFYSQPNAAEPRGLYNYNGSNLDKRSLVNAGTLIYHELVPGHHFQIALQDENPALTPFRKHYSVGAFNEGWGEYAASLGIELDLYDSPEALYGRYVNEMFLAARLVVDTGMNAFGWPLEKARAYMHDVTSHSDVEIASETLRYSVNIPGQALAYRTGYDEFWALRRKAEKELGDRFDIRDFHGVILMPGARPMPVVEADVEAYIAGQRSTPK